MGIQLLRFGKATRTIDFCLDIFTLLSQ